MGHALPLEPGLPGYATSTGSENAALAKLLSAGAPDSPAESPPVFYIDRKRNVEIDWRAVRKAHADTATPPSMRALKDHLTRTWRDGKLRVTELGPGNRSKDSVPDGFVLVPPQPPADKAFRCETNGAAVATEVEKGVVVTEGISARRYHLLPRDPETPLTIQSLATDPHWRSVAGMELVFDTKADAEAFRVQFSEIDLRPSILVRQFHKLEIMRSFATEVDAKLPAATDDRIAKLLQSGAGAAEVAELEREYTRLRMRDAEITDEQRRLASLASNMGLLLCIDDDAKVTLPDGTAHKLERGKIYKPYRRTVHWNTTYTVSGGFLDLFEEVVVVPHTAVVTDYEPIDTGIDLFARWRRGYLVKAQAEAKAGAKADATKDPGIQFFVMKCEGGRFVSEGGDSIHSILNRCLVNEAFRRKCVILLPVYETALTGERVLTRYHAFERPMPGLIATRLPTLALQEVLTYRTVWAGMKVGELVGTINLAPGERRTIRLAHSYERESVVSDSSVSVFDVSRNDSTEFSDALERTARQEKETSFSLQTSMSTSGSFLGESASASATSGVDHSTKDFAESISNVAKKAARTATRNSRQDISSTRSTTTSIKTTNETSAEIHNINEGRTLNLSFHRVYNRYRGGLYVEGIKFALVPGVEVISGSGIFEAIEIDLGDADRLLQRIASLDLPFEASAETRQELARVVIRRTSQLLADEYARGGGRPANARSIGVLSLPSDWEARFHAALEPATRVGHEAVRDQLRAIADTLDSNLLIAEVDLMVGSTGVYTDAQVGAIPSTEPYSELMRGRELRARDAEIFGVASEGRLRDAQAARVAALSDGDDGLRIVQIWRNRERTTLQVELSAPLPRGVGWALTYDGKRVAGEYTADADRSHLTFNWPPEQSSSLDDPDLDLKLTLEDADTGRVISFPARLRARQ